MNIFYLHRDPIIAARYQCDKHVVKMILESAQMLSTAHRVCDGDTWADLVGLYKTVHKNHPSTLWARASVPNYMWLYHHMTGLMNEYTYRYEKTHATERLLDPLKKPPILMTETHQWHANPNFAPPPQCVPEECKREDTVEAYREYYIKEKSYFAKWKKRAIPEWFKVTK